MINNIDINTIDSMPMFSPPYETKNNKKCHSDFSTSSNIHPKLSTDLTNGLPLDTVSFAPFLMWNVHENKYFENVGLINDLAINDNNLYDTKDKHNSSNYAEMMRELFFSAENIDIIQNGLIKNVFFTSDETLRINKIKEETLIQYMNYVWTNFCRYLPYDFKNQINELDDKVIEQLTPLLLQEYQFYTNYLRDADRSNLPLLERAVMISKNRKQQLNSYYN